MKILQVCHRVPFPPIDGGNIAMMNMALSLIAAGNEVHQFCLNTSRHFIDTKEIPIHIVEKLHLTTSAIDTRINVKDAFLNLFQNDSYNIQRFYSTSVEHDLVKKLKSEEFDFVQLETLFSAPYISAIKKNSKAKIILRAHNVEHIIWERLALSQKNPIKKRYLTLLSKRLKKFELKTLHDVDAIIPITDIDEAHFRKLNYNGPMISLPLGVDLKEYIEFHNKDAALNLVHLGSMDWLPNREGVEWFLKKCWTTIHSKHPLLKLFLAGRDFPKELEELNPPNVIFQGRVDHANNYLSDKQIMIVPLFSGSGMRVKIIQGLVLGKTIISTTIGAEGIDITHGKNILLADTPEDFLMYVTRCLENPIWCREIGLNGYQLAIEKYSLEAVGKSENLFLKNLQKSKN